ncbi:class I SAM-dependent DNA methyltransferase [Anabaena azotica]|uniref:class I SAM-dependent DNA methyltransferase n=1 Tax=Anabaena azotica TaxID=197653 RepID=UPI0039A48356
MVEINNISTQKDFFENQTTLPIDNNRTYEYDGNLYDRFEEGSLYYLEQQQDIPFWLDIAKEYGESILELACGTGRIAIVLAQHGFQVTGIDISNSMLEAARKKSSQVEWKKADVRDFDLDKKFSLIIFPYNSLHHLLTTEEIEACFNCVKKHLHPTGKFVIDITNPSPQYLLELFVSKQRTISSIFQIDDGGEMVVATRTREYEADKQILRLKRYYKFPHQTEEVIEELKFRLYFPQEFKSVLRYNGFKSEKLYGDYSKNTFTSDSPQMIVLCSVSN